jgi:hypothetical protein
MMGPRPGHRPLPPHGRRRVTFFSAAAAAIAGGATCVWTQQARAQIHIYAGPDNGDWDGSPALNWIFDPQHGLATSRVAVPPPGATAFLIPDGGSGTSSFTINYNYAYSGTGLGNLFIESGNNLRQASATSVMSALSEQLGIVGTGTYTQLAGSNTTGNLELAPSPGNPAARGIYQLAGGTLTTQTEILGFGGAATFLQTAGSHSGASMTLGGAFSISTYQLSGGTLTMSGSESIGSGFLLGQFNQNAGTHTVTTLNVPFGGFGDMTPVGGTYVLSGVGVLISGTVNIGLGGGSGDFQQAGGTHIAQTLYLSPGTNLNQGLGGAATVVAGTSFYSLSNSAVLHVLGTEFVGFDGTGTLSQTGGFHTAADLVLGANRSSNFASVGNFNLIAGTLEVSGTETIGLNGVGVFVQSGGFHSAGALMLGASGNFIPLPPGSGSYALGEGATLSVAGNETLGLDGFGSFTQTGGNHAVGGELQLGRFFDGSGTFNLSGDLAASTLSVVGDVTVGYDSTGSLFVPGGIFNQSGASFAIATASHAASLYIGRSAGASGVYNLSGGVLTVYNGNAYVGYAGIGNFTQTGGTAVISAIGPTGTNAGGLFIGYTNGSIGTASLTNGTLSINYGSAFVGYFGTGRLFQSGGSNTVNSLVLGFGSNSTGAVEISGGTLSATNGIFIGVQGSGTYHQTGGTVTSRSLSIGSLTSASNITGSFTMGAGRMFISNDVHIGDFGNAAYAQSGGDVSIGGNLMIGEQGGNGSIDISGGTLTAAGATLNNRRIGITGSALMNLQGITGSGAISVGGNAGDAALVSVASMSQSSLTVGVGGEVAIRPAAARLTNMLGKLTLGANGGTLDIANHELLVASTPPSAIKAYLAAAYDPNGKADWSKPGLTSSLAQSNPEKYTVAYAFGGDQSAKDADILLADKTPLPSNQTLARATLTGDANLDGSVNFFDLTQVLGYSYNTGKPASYTDGDLNYDGVVDFFDIVTLLSANYNSGQAFGAGLGQAAAGPASVPEPSSCGAVGFASATLLLCKRRRRRKA